MINQSLADDLKSLGLWDTTMIHDLKYYNGSVKNISRVPDDIKKLYATAFEVDAKWLIDAASRRQKWIDQAQSLNLYIDVLNNKVNDIHNTIVYNNVNDNNVDINKHITLSDERSE